MTALRESLNSINSILDMPVHIFAVLVQLFLFLYAQFFWGDSIGVQFLVYLVMLAFAYTMLRAENPLKQVSIRNAVIQYISGFVIGLMFFIVAGLGSPESSGYGGFSSLSGLILAQTLIVALSEELLFRGMLPKVLEREGIPYFYACIASILVFAVFHGWAYEWNIGSILAAAAFGAIMQVIWDAGRVFDFKNKAGGYPLMSVGLHAAWNCVLVLPFTVLFGV